MQLIWVDDSFPEKERNNNDHLDNSRTTDTISHLNNLDEFSQNENIENNYISTLNKKVNNKNDEERLVISNFKNKRIKNNNISFKKRLSIILCIIYLILFLLCIPKIAIKIGGEQNIDVLIENNSNEKMNILINKISSFCNECYNKHKSSGYILEFRINKMYILRWLIGFFYFIIKCICFIYSNQDNNNNYFLDKNKINLIQKASMLFFPLSLFYYDLKNNLSFSKIKSEKINNKVISFYIETTRQFYLIDYVEGLIPTLFYFLISIDYDKFDKIINLYHIKRSKLNKLV